MRCELSSYFLHSRDLVGITKPVNLVQDRDLTAKYLWFRSEPSETENTGLYKQIVDEELRAHIWYRTSTWAANILLALQILIAASITAIGGSKEARRGTATVVLGAVNTAIAAMLAFLKAKGLPASASHYRDMIKKQKAEIDYMHRAFCIGSANINPASAAAKAHDDFHKAHSDFDTAMSTFQRAATSTHRNLQSAQGTFAKGTATAPTKDGAAVAAPVGDSAEEGGQPSGPEIIAAASETGEGVMKPELQEKEIV